jgi:hypothetical protein
MAAKYLFPDEIQVIGWENGGVSVVCKHCDFELGGGGCDCCSDNEVTLADLLMTAEVLHECKEQE